MPQQQQSYRTTSYEVTPILAPVKGIRYDEGGTLIKDDEMTDDRNMFISTIDTLRKREGTLVKGDQLNGMVLGLDQYYQTDGTEFLMCETAKDAYYWTGDAWMRISPGNSYNGTFDDQWVSETMLTITAPKGAYFFTNGVDHVQMWDGTTLSNMGSHATTGPLLNIAGSPIYMDACVCILKYHDYMLAGYTTESGTPYPQRVRWSDTGLPDTSPNSGYDGWTVGPDSNAGYQDLTDGVDYITCLTTLNDRVIVLKERSIYSGYLSGTTFVFEFDLMINGTGTPNGHTVMNVKNDLIFMGWDNIYSFNGITITAIGDQIKDELFTIINPAVLKDCFALLVEELDEYQLFITTGSNTYPDTVFRYNYVKKAWTRDSRTNITAVGYFEKETTYEWIHPPAGDNTTWDEQVVRWDDRQLLAAAPTYLLGDNNGYVYEWDFTKVTDNGALIDAWFSTKDFTMTMWDTDKYWARLDIIGRGISCDVYYSTDEGTTYIPLGTVNFDSSSTFNIEKVDFRVTSQRIRFKFENPRAETFEIRQITLYWEKGGRY